MTRINTIDPVYLVDQHLLAEYRELPRIVNAVCDGRANMNNLPLTYTMGKGHVRFFYDKVLYLLHRYSHITHELSIRNYNLSNNYDSLNRLYFTESNRDQRVWLPDKTDKSINLNRLAGKIMDKINNPSNNWYYTYKGNEINDADTFMSWYRLVYEQEIADVL